MPSSRSSAKQQPNQLSHSWQFEAIGTKWWIGIFEPLATSKLEALKKQIDDRIEAYDKAYSRFREDSLVTKISKQPGTYKLPADSAPLLDFYRQLYDATNGSVTPLIGDTLSQAGYDATYSLRPKAIKTPPHWQDVMEYKKGQLTTKQPVLLDFGAAGKGYLIDIVTGLLEAAQVRYFCVDAGGDMVVRSQTPLRVGLEHPDDTTQILGVAELSHGAVAGSAGNRRVWGEYHHIMDPMSLKSVTAIKAVWVVAETAMLADGLSTALFFVPPDALDAFSFEYLVINEHNQFISSSGFPAQLFAE